MGFEFLVANKHSAGYRMIDHHASRQSGRHQLEAVRSVKSYGLELCKMLSSDTAVRVRVGLTGRESSVTIWLANIINPFQTRS